MGAGAFSFREGMSKPQWTAYAWMYISSSLAKRYLAPNHRSAKSRCDRLHVVQAMQVMLTLDPTYDPKLDASIPPDIIHSQLPQITVRQMHNKPNDCLLASILAIFSAA